MVLWMWAELSIGSIKRVLFSILIDSYAPLFSDKAPSEATFKGTEFLSYDLGQTGGEPIVSAQDAISLFFRTRQPNGLLFFTGKARIDPNSTTPALILVHPSLRTRN